MKKSHKIIYWISTLWLALGMVSTGIVQFMQLDEEVAFVLDLGYPAYFLSIIGTWKILGVIAILVPNYTLIKEWAYAGFFFLMSGAIISHISVGEANAIFPATLLLTLTLVSWYFRPASRKVVLTEANKAKEELDIAEKSGAAVIK